MRMKFFDEIGELTCIAGDTLPVFEIEADLEKTDGYGMAFILADECIPDAAVLCKECTADGKLFTVQLTSTETAVLDGIYNIIFSLTDPDDNTLRKLVGKLLVLSAPTSTDIPGGGGIPVSSYYTKSETNALLSQKVDKITGKGLSAEDYTTAEKTKLASLENYDDTALTEQLSALSAALTDAAKATQSNTTLYVNAETGSDDNAGTSGAPFATVEKAVTEGCKYRSAIINIAAGTYTLTSGSIEIRGEHSLSIRGAGADSTIINGRFSADRGAYVNFMNLAVNSTADSASNGGIFGFESAQIYLTGVSVSASTGACVNLSTGAQLYAVSCTFSGTPSYTVRSASGSRAVVRGCTGIEGKNARAEVSGELRLDQCTDMTYTAATQGVVFVNGIQAAPAAS